MAAKDNKFGTFGGVYTPSLLTILGVIMYLRLPRVVGESGLPYAIVIIVFAHVVSISTGLSISSIATDRNVGAGGPYYIVSRSLGLPIGGTLGLALFLGLSFSISLYVIGFSESFLATIGVPLTATAIRICGTITVALVTIITFISTSFAIKTQYVILALIACSLVAVFLGSPTVPSDGVLLDVASTDVKLGDVFGIFFPAVTGFTAGVNMSGDLRDPKKAIPTGTMAAIATGLVVYLGLAIYLGTRFSRQELLDNPRVLEDAAFFGPAVTAGIWGATLSSALGSILGAPRILQTISADGITPRWFARGHGKTNEPRNALLLAFLIGWGGILIAQLDVIARVVSMVFMAMYAFLNIAAAIESSVSPDFRPDFKIPRTVSVLGAVASLALMFQMDAPAMIGATAMMAVLYAWLQRRQLRLDSGDAWEGVWSTLVRAGLHRLSSSQRQHRNWRPNILMFRPLDGQPRAALRRTAATLITGNGMLTDVRLRTPGQAAPEDEAVLDGGPVVGLFSRDVDSDDPYETVRELARHHGFSGLEPNTVLVDWDALIGDEERLGAMVDDLRARDLNTLLFADATHEPPAGTPPRIDVWWRSTSSPTLGIALIRFITSSPRFRKAHVRFLTVSRDSSINDALRNAARRLLEEARVTAEVDVVLDAVDPMELEDHVTERSADAVLAIVELPEAPLAAKLPALSAVCRAVPSVLFVAPSSMFLSAGRVIRALPAPEETRESRPPEDLPPLRLPETEGAAPLASSFSENLERTLLDFYDHSITRLAERNVALLDRTSVLVDKHFGLLGEGLGERNPVKQRRNVNRVQSAFLIECGKLIDEFVQQDLADQRDILEGRLRALAEDAELVDAEAEVTLEAPRSTFAPRAADPKELARLKAARMASGGGETVRWTLDAAPLQSYYADKALTEVVDDVVRAFVSDSWSLAVHLLKTFNASRTSLTLIHGAAELDENAMRSFVDGQKAQANDALAELRLMSETRIGELRARLAADTRALSQSFADDLDRVDAELLPRTIRRPSRHRDALRKAVIDQANTFYDLQRALFERAQIGLKVSAFQHRVATNVEKVRERVVLELKNGVLNDYLGLRNVLETFLEEEADEPLKVSLDLKNRFDAQGVIDALSADAQSSAEELVETTETLSDDSIQRLADGDHEAVEFTDLSLRRLVQFLLDTELVGPLTQLLSEVPVHEQRAVGVAEDVIRLIGFHQNEFDPRESDGGFHAHMRPVVENGLERLTRELGPLETIAPKVEELLETQLAAVLRGTDVYQLTHSAQTLGQHIRRHQGQRAVFGAQSIALRGVEQLRQGLVSAVYGRSAGVLMARRLRESSESGGAVVDRVSRFVEESSPDSAVLEDLPFYYRQLFFGKNTFNETFWVERTAEIARARRGIAQHDRGGRGVLIVTGEPDSGKTALMQRLVSRDLSRRKTYWVRPPNEGSVDPKAFRRALAEATSERGRPPDILAALADQSVMVLEDLELWWERSADGLQVIDELLALIETHAHRILFVIEVSALPLQMINRFRPLADHALSVVECGPLPAESLKEIVMLRHGSTGVSFELDGIAEADLSEWRLARLFSQHFSASRGLVGAALTSWITHVDAADARSIQIRAPERQNAEVFDQLKSGWVALLVQLLLHKRLDRARLTRVTGLESAVLDAQLDALFRMGVVRQSRQDVLRIDRFITPALIERLRERKVLP